MASYDCMRRRYLWARGAVKEIQHIAESIDEFLNGNVWEWYVFPSSVARVCEDLDKMLGAYLDHIEFGDSDLDYDEEGNLLMDRCPPCPEPYTFEAGAVDSELPHFVGAYMSAMFRFEYLLRVLDENIRWMSPEVMQGYMDEPIGRSVLYALARIRRAVNEQIGIARWGLKATDW